MSAAAWSAERIWRSESVAEQGDGEPLAPEPDDLTHREDAAGPEEPLTVLIDDVRLFRDGRPCLLARTSGEAVALLLSLRARHIAHLWLDHDLIGNDDIWPVVRLLEDAHLRGEPLDIGLVHIQAARSGPAHRMAVSLRRAGYIVERSVDLKMWTR